MDQLNILRANQYPKATESIDQMITLIESLIKNNSAYEVNGSVYFRIDSCPKYGCLSKKNIDDLNAGHRVGVETQKESPLDFILWKPSKPEEPSWKSPWGAGRPGWHTECVAMVNDQLGPHIDIHGGGADLQFPHHENELAQATCAYHTPFANIWVHNGFVTINEEKMSKSLNNFFTLREVLKEYPAEVVRFFLMRTHYRAPLNYSTDTLQDAQTQYNKLATTLETISNAQPSTECQHDADAHINNFWAALYSDLNISEAIAPIF
jgi:cysteinyl-tRNA synthetase